MVMVGQQHTPATSPLGKKPSTQCTGDWVGQRVSLGRCRKSHPQQGFDPQTYQPVVNCYSHYTLKLQRLSICNFEYLALIGNQLHEHTLPIW